MMYLPLHTWRTRIIPEVLEVLHAIQRRIVLLSVHAAYVSAHGNQAAAQQLASLPASSKGSGLSHVFTPYINLIQSHVHVRACLVNHGLAHGLSGEAGH